MKKQKQTSLGLKSIQLMFIALIAMLIFYSCSKEDDMINNSGKSTVNKSKELNSKDKSNVIIGGDFIQDNVNAYSETILVIYSSLDNAIHQNLYVGFNAQVAQMLNNAQTENDVKIAFESAGIANSQEVLDILKNIVYAQQAFIAENRNFYNLTLEQRMEYLNSGVETTKNNFLLSNPPVTPAIPFATFPGCAHTFNVGVDRCIEDYVNCGVGAVIGTAFGGLIPGIIAAGQCMVTKYNCDKRIKQDYKDCQAQEYVHGVPGPEAVLTLHCTTERGAVVDSCWTTYNGTYFGRIN